MDFDVSITKAETEKKALETSRGGALKVAPGAVEAAPVARKAKSATVIAWPSGGAQPSGERPRRFNGVLLSFLLVVLLPTACVTAYLLFWATPRYVSEFRVAVRSAGGATAGQLPSLLGLSGISQSGNDSNAVVQYLQSHDAVADLDATLSLRDHYSNPSIDFFSRLDPKAADETFLRYWQGMIDAYYESTTGTIVVQVSAFSSEKALAISTRALKSAEDLINRLSTRARDDTVGYAEAEVNKSESRLNEVDAKLKVLRDKDKILDAQKAAESTLALAAKLEERLASLRANLSTQLSSMDANAPSALATRHTIDGLQEQLDRINAGITASPGSGDGTLSNVIGDFDQLENQRLFAEKAYQSALAALETARLEATRQQVYLTTIVTPSLPQDSSFPQPWRGGASTFGTALAIWAVLVLAASAVRQHL